MTLSARLGLALLPLFMGGCASLMSSMSSGGGRESPDSFHQQLSHYERFHGAGVGIIKKDLQPSSEPRPAACSEGRSMTFESHDASARRICFTKSVYDFEYDDADPSRFVKAESRKPLYALETWPSLEAMRQAPARKVLPAPEQRVTAEVTVLENRREDERTKSAIYENSTYISSTRNVLLRLCFPSPELTADTAYLTVSRDYEPRVQTGGSVYIQDNNVPQLYLFQVTDSAYPSLMEE